MQEVITWSPGVTLEEIEKQVILKAFRFYRGNKTATAIALGISVKTIDNKLNQYIGDKETNDRKEAERKSERESFLARQRGIPQSAPLASHGTDAGVNLESAPLSSSEHAMSLSQRKEVQEMPQKSPSRGRARKTS